MEHPEKRVASSSTPRYSSYWKWSLRVTLDFCRPTIYLCEFVFGFRDIANLYLIIEFLERRVLKWKTPWFYCLLLFEKLLNTSTCYLAKNFFLMYVCMFVYPPEMARCSRGVMVKALDCGIVISEFERQSRYYVHFRTNTLGKGMNPLILPAMN